MACSETISFLTSFFLQYLFFLLYVPAFLSYILSFVFIVLHPLLYDATSHFMLSLCPFTFFHFMLSLVILTLTVLVATTDAQWEGMGDVGSARYELAPLLPCPTIRVLSYGN